MKARLIRATVYLLAFVVPPVLVSIAGVKMALADRYPAPPASATATHLSPAPPLDPTKPTAVLLLNHGGSEVTDVLAPFEVLSESGAFNVYLATPEPRAALLSGGLDVLPHVTFSDLDRLLSGRSPDVIVVPAMWHVGSEDQRPVAQWLRQHAPNATTVVSICDGAEVLADAGLLEGRRATANWANLAKWERRYPDIEWVSGKRYIADGNVLSSAGVTSGTNAALRVVRNYVGDAAATDLASRLAYPDTRVGDEPSIPLHKLTPSDRALYVLGGAYDWTKPRVGVVLTDGVSEIELASAFDAYPGPAFTARATSLAPGGPAAPITSRHGVRFIPRYDLSGAPPVDRLLVPGRDAARRTSPELQAWARDRGLDPEYVHAGTGHAFPFDATLPDLAEHTNVPWARFTTRLLEYPETYLVFTGRGFPWLWLARPIGVGLLGLAAAVALDRLVLTSAVRRARRRHPERTGDARPQRQRAA